MDMNKRFVNSPSHEVRIPVGEDARLPVQLVQISSRKLVSKGRTGIEIVIQIHLKLSSQPVPEVKVGAGAQKVPHVPDLCCRAARLESHLARVGNERVEKGNKKGDQVRIIAGINEKIKAREAQRPASLTPTVILPSSAPPLERSLLEDGVVIVDQPPRTEDSY
jgi:hypothetical protein